MRGVRSLYTFLYWVSIFGLRTFYLGIKCHLAPFTVLFTNYFIFGGKWFHFSYYNEGQESRKPGRGVGVLWIQVTGMIEWGLPTKRPPKNPGSKNNRKTIPGRISEPYMLKFPEGIKRYKKKNKNIGNWVSLCLFLHSIIWSYRGHLQIVQNTPKILRKSSQILTRKIPESKVSNAKKSFDLPRQLKSGVPRPLGSQAPRSSRHAWKIRPTVVSQGIHLGCGGPDDNDDDDDDDDDVDDTVMIKWTSGLELRVTHAWELVLEKQQVFSFVLAYPIPHTCLLNVRLRRRFL